jgi:hypothetical protein
MGVSYPKYWQLYISNIIECFHIAGIRDCVVYAKVNDDSALVGCGGLAHLPMQTSFYRKKVEFDQHEIQSSHCWSLFCLLCNCIRRRMLNHPNCSILKTKFLRKNSLDRFRWPSPFCWKMRSVSNPSMQPVSDVHRACCPVLSLISTPNLVHSNESKRWASGHMQPPNVSTAVNSLPVLHMLSG